MSDMRQGDGSGADDFAQIYITHQAVFDNIMPKYSYKF